MVRKYKTDAFGGIYREENRDKAQREAAFYSGDACENTSPRKPRKYSNTRVPRRQPLGSVVTCPVIYGCNTAATLLFVVFTHISRSPAGRDRSAPGRNTAGWEATVISVDWNIGETRKREKNGEMGMRNERRETRGDGQRATGDGRRATATGARVEIRSSGVIYDAFSQSGRAKRPRLLPEYDRPSGTLCRAYFFRGNRSLVECYVTYCIFPWYWTRKRHCDFETRDMCWYEHSTKSSVCI